MAGMLYLRQQGEKYSAEKKNRDKVLSPFFSSPKSLSSAASAHSCFCSPHFTAAQAGGTGLNPTGASGLETPCSPEAIPFAILELRVPGIYFI